MRAKVAKVQTVLLLALVVLALADLVHQALALMARFTGYPATFVLSLVALVVFEWGVHRKRPRVAMRPGPAPLMSGYHEGDWLTLDGRDAVVIEREEQSDGASAFTVQLPDGEWRFIRVY